MRAFAPLTTQAGAQVTGKTGPSSVVQLSREGVARQAADAPPPVSTAQRFKGLGAAMLSAVAAGAIAPAEQPLLPQDLDNQFALRVVTASGKQVALTLANRGEELFVAVEADADLTDAERDALSALAKGFQDAIDGMAQGEPSVRLAGLSALDGAFASISFRSEVSIAAQPPARMSMDFRIDGQERSVKIAGPRGSVEVNVDTSRPELLGSRQQQERAIGRYLKQADQAAERGHGDAQLVAMFKDAFSSISRTATRDEGTLPAASSSRWVLEREDQAVLTGLSDFRASIVQTAQQVNPARRDEVDDFSYGLSQESRLEGNAFADRAISQRQASRLSAQFHEPLASGDKLALDFRSESQNYRYRQIDDSAASSVELGYKDGRLVKARLEQSVSQSERVREYVFGRLKSDRTIPEQHSLLRDLVALLAPYQTAQDGAAVEEGREAREERRRGVLQALGADVLLPASRAELAERDARTRTQP